MKKLRRVLVAVADLRQGNGGALRRAAALARATGARIELFHAVTAPLTQSRRIGRQWIDHELTPEDSLGVAEKALERIAGSMLLRGCRVEPVAVWGKPAHEAIVRRALDTRTDLIINGTRSRGRADRLVLRHTDWELVRHSPVPLLLVKSGRRAAREVVLAAIDPLHANAKPARLDGRILDAAGGVAKALKGTLHAFHSYMPLSITMAAGIGEPVVWDSSQIDATHMRQVLRAFSRALQKTGIPPRRRHLRMGDVATELSAAARRLHATLVVMGAVSRSGLERLLIGNTAQRVIDELKCDVLIVKPL
jgi:universal stress protein E